MAKEKKQEAAAQQSAAVAAPQANPLDQFGGVSFLEDLIDDYASLNKDREGRRNLFLNNEKWADNRAALKTRLEMWKELLTEKGGDIKAAADDCKEKAASAETTLNKNLGIALNATKTLETSYRSVQNFYDHSESEKIKNITILNATPGQVKDLENPRFINAVATELKQNFDRLDLRKNYSLLVIPGYMERNPVLNRWAQIAYDNKAMLLTDYADLGTPDDVVDMFSEADHTSAALNRSAVMMTCNWLLGRNKVERAGEKNDLFVPPSTALAGKIYGTLMSQVAAGKKFGGLGAADGVRFDLKKSEISEMESLGLIPMVYEYKSVMAFSGKTLFNGDNLGLQTYSVVRVFDYITKVLFDFLNRKAFENWTTATERDLRKQIVKFLDSIQGPKRLIEKFRILKIDRDPNQKDRILLDIHITPYFPAKSFVIELHGHKGDESENVDWESKYKQAEA